VQKKKNIFMNWNEELMSSVRPVIDHAFRRLLDRSVENLKAEAAQTIKEALRDLDHILRSKFFFRHKVLYSFRRQHHFIPS
jgi:hypothetical protein